MERPSALLKTEQRKNFKLMKRKRHKNRDTPDWRMSADARDGRCFNCDTTIH